MWWRLPVQPALARLETPNCKASLGWIMRLGTKTQTVILIVLGFRSQWLEQFLNAN